MIATFNKPMYWGLAVLALLYWRNHNGAAHSGVTRTQEANEASEVGSDFLPDLWAMLNGEGVSSANFPNLVPGANANGGGHTAANLGLAPAWDGSLQ